MKKNTNAYYFEPELKISIEMPPKLLTPDEKINNMNLKRIITKTVDSYSGYGWDVDVALSVADLYRAFLYLCKTYPTEVIVPTKEVDDFWHMHILDTRNYILDCEEIFGFYLHHFPYAGLEGTKVTHEEEVQFIENTISLLEKNFPELIA